MRRTRVLALTLMMFWVCVSSWAQTEDSVPLADPIQIPEGADIYVVPRGMIVRGGLISFSVYLGPNVRHLSSIQMTVERVPGAGIGGFVGDPNSLSLGGEGPGLDSVAVAPPGSALLAQGALLVGATYFITGRAFKGSNFLSVPYPGLVTGNGAGSYSYNVIFDSPISGPGELFTFRLYVPISTPSTGVGSQLGVSSVTYKSPIVEAQSANDPEGNPLVLKSVSSSVESDLRLFGDANGDGKLTQSDAIYILRSIVGLQTLTDAQRWYADIQPGSSDGKPLSGGRYLGDGSVGLKDSRRVLEVITGIWKGWWPDPRPAG